MSTYTDPHNSAARPALAERQRLFRTALQRAHQDLLKALQTQLTQADDLFFDLSNRATSNTEQNCYFEAMRELRQQSTQVLLRFRDACQHGSQQAEQAPVATNPSNHHPDTLELVKPEVMEQNVAVAGIVTKLRGNHGRLLRSTAWRLGWLVDNPLTEKHFPLDPQQLCQYFLQATQDLDLHIKARLVLLKQFDQLVISLLPNLLQRLEQQLQQLGFVPEAPPPAAAARAMPTRRDDTATREFDNLASLLSNLRAFGISIPSAPHIAHLHNGQTLPNAELIRDISRLQGLYTHRQPSGAREIRGVVQQVLTERSRSGQPASLSALDEDIINLMALFFDQILEDSTLPTSVQLLISRLQLQTLKAALRSPDFFDDPAHPARQFIESLAEAGLGCGDDPHNPLLTTMQDAVQTVLDDVQASPATFTAQAERVRQILRAEQRKSALIEKRTNESALGMARSRHAREQVQQSLYTCLRDHSLPAPVLDFLVTTWRDVLFQITLKFGQNSPEWREGMALVQDLLRCAQQTQPDLARSLPARANRLSDRVVTPTTSQSDTFRQLAAVCQQWQSGNPPAGIPLGPLHTEALGQSLANALDSWDTAIAQQQEEKKYASLHFDALRQTDILEPGTWIARQDPLQPGHEQRCKLAARIQESDSYIFVDHNGFRVLELSRRSLALELQRGKLRLLDDGPLFDRTFQAIRRNIHQLTGSISASH